MRKRERGKKKEKKKKKNKKEESRNTIALRRAQTAVTVKGK